MRVLTAEIVPGRLHPVYVIVRGVRLEGALAAPLALSTSKRSRITHRGWIRLSQAAVEAAREGREYNPYQPGFLDGDIEALNLVVRGYDEFAEAALPICADERWFRLSGKELAQAFGAVGYAALKEPTPPWYGIWINTWNGLEFAATDNARVALVQAAPTEVVQDGLALVPRYAALAAARLFSDDDQVEVRLGRDAVEFRTETNSVLAQSLRILGSSGQPAQYRYPDVAALFRVQRPTMVVIPDTARFEAELLLVGTDTKDGMITMAGVSGGLILSATHSYGRMAMTTTGNEVIGEDFQLILDYRLIREVVQRARGALTLRVGGPLEHVLLQSAESPVQHAIMPARRNEFAEGGKV